MVCAVQVRRTVDQDQVGIGHWGLLGSAAIVAVFILFFVRDFDRTGRIAHFTRVPWQVEWTGLAAAEQSKAGNRSNQQDETCH